MTLSIDDRQQKLAQCVDPKDFYALYVLNFGEEVPEIWTTNGEEKLDMVIDAIIDNKKIEKKELPELWD